MIQFFGVISWNIITCEGVENFTHLIQDQKCYSCPDDLSMVTTVNGNGAIICNKSMNMGKFVFCENSSLILGTEPTNLQFQLLVSSQSIGQFNVTQVEVDTYIQYTFIDITADKILQLNNNSIRVSLDSSENTTIIVNFIQVNYFTLQSLSQAKIDYLDCNHVQFNINTTIECILIETYNLISRAHLTANTINSYYIRFEGDTFIENDVHCNISIFYQVVFVSQIFVCQTISIYEASIITIDDVISEIFLVGRLLKNMKSQVQISRLSLNTLDILEKNEMNVGELFVNGIMNISGTLVIESFSIFEGSLLSCNGSVIVFSKLISIKSNLIIVQYGQPGAEIYIELIQLENSTFNSSSGLQVEFLNLTQSQVYILNYISIRNIVCRYSLLFTTRHTKIIKGDFDIKSVLSTTSLELGDYGLMGNITVNISNVTLLNAIKDENYSQLLFNLMRYPPESEDYSYYEKQSIIQDGTLFVHQSVTFATREINASMLIVHGILKPRAVFNNTEINIILTACLYIHNQIDTDRFNLLLMTIVDQNFNLEESFLDKQIFIKLLRSFVVQQLSVVNSHVRLISTSNQNLFKLIVSHSLTQNMQSRIDGPLAFSTVNQQIEIGFISILQGEVTFMSTNITICLQCKLFAQSFKVSNPNIDIFILGLLVINSTTLSNSYQPQFDITAKKLYINNVSIIGLLPKRNDQSCCGSSSYHFGGCSFGQPQPIIELDFEHFGQETSRVIGSNADSCRPKDATAYLQGGQSGGAMRIVVDSLFVGGLINVSGTPGLCDQKMRCAGSGAGGSILMDVTEFNYNRDFIVHAEGANCLHQNDIISGGAGSGGYFLLRFDYLKNETHQIQQGYYRFVGNMKYNLSDQNDSMPFEVFTNDGVCLLFPTRTINTFCNATFTYLDVNSMSCRINSWFILAMLLCIALVISLAVYLSVCICAHCRKQLANVIKDEKINSFVVNADQLYLLCQEEQSIQFQ